jgi:cell volume regulation protein A
VIGAGCGLLVGVLGRALLPRARLLAGGLYPVLTVALALIAFGAPTLVEGSGFLAVYLAGMLIGNGDMPHRQQILRAHDSLAWGSQILMFLTLGLLVFPSHLVAVAPRGLGIALWLIVVARPVAVAACLAPFGFSRAEILHIGWVGLRGAVPIILATYPVLAGLPGADTLFDVVFFVVLVSVLLQGTTARALTQRLGLAGVSAPAPAAELEINARHPLSGELLSYAIGPESAVVGTQVGEIPLPEGTSIVLVVRGSTLLPAAPGLTLEQDDHVHIVVPRGEKTAVQLLFGAREES